MDASKKIEELEAKIRDKDTEITLLKAQCRCTDKILANAYSILEEHKRCLQDILTKLTPGTVANAEYMKTSVVSIQNEILTRLGKKNE